MKDFRGVEIQGGDRVAIVSKQGLAERKVTVANGLVFWLQLPGHENPRAKSSGPISSSNRIVVLHRADGTLPEMPVV